MRHYSEELEDFFGDLSDEDAELLDDEPEVEAVPEESFEPEELLLPELPASLDAPDLYELLR